MFPDVKVKNYDYIDSIRLSSPTCEQLGIPNDDQRYPMGPVRNASLHIDGIRYEAVSKTKGDPFSPFSMIPLPSPFGSVFDSSCIRRRNERERDRVRCVNDGYVKLKDHLPLDNKDKRISKVETLRGAIQYIKHLQSILENSNSATCPEPSGNIEHKSDYTVTSERLANTRLLFDCDTDNERHATEMEGHSSHGTGTKLNAIRASITMRPN